MTTAIKRRRGTTTQHSTFTGLEGEITVDTTKDTLVVHDGAQAGGYPLLREDLSNNTTVSTASNTQTLTNKTIAFGSNTVSGTIAQFNTALTDADFSTLGGTETFTNKTFNLTSNTLSGTTAQFNTALSDGDFATLAGTETLSNKTFSTNPTISSGTANGVAYLNGSKVLTTGTDLVFTSTGLGIGTSSPSNKLDIVGSVGIKSAGLLKLYNAANSSTSELSSDATGLTQFSHTGVTRWLNATATTELMRLDSSGNLGLGVTPSAWSATAKAFQFGTYGGAVYQNASGYPEIGFNTYINASNIYTYFGNDVATRYSQTNGQHRWFTAPSGTAGNAISFTQAMTLDASGNLGIGTSSPTRKLQVYTTSSDYQLRLGFSDAYFYDIGRSAADGLFYFYGNQSGANGYVFGGINGERMRIDSSGNVGIGTSSPTTKFQVSGSSFLVGDIVNTGTAQPDSAGWRATNGSVQVYLSAYSYGGAAELNVASNHPVLFKTNNTERMRIDSSGNLLVGTTSSLGNYKFQINGDFSSAYGQTVKTTAASGYFINFSTSSGQCGYIFGSGTTTAYNTSSDYRLKENIQPMQNALAVVQQLNPVTYTWKADGSDGQGFIAHELQAIVPDCVTGEKDAVDAEGKPVYQGIDTSFLVATLTKAIQELKAELDATKAEVAALKGN